MSSGGLNLLVVAGIRSQYVKLAAFQTATREWNASGLPPVSCTYINGGQHYDDVLARQYIEELGVVFDIDLTPRFASREPMRLTADMIVYLYEAFRSLRPGADWVITFGDANTTLAASLAAAKAGIRLVHVESGVRLGTFASSEEINRVVADRLAHVRFASTHRDQDNLCREGLGDLSYWVGDIIFDLVVRLKPRLHEVASRFGVGSEYVLASLHRAENVDSGQILEDALIALQRLGRPALFLAHPRARRAAEYVRRNGLSHVVVVEGLGYVDTLSAMASARFVFTDSGAFQREAYYLEKRCLIRQDRAFWQSLVDSGAHATCGSDGEGMATGLLDMDHRVSLGGPYPKLDDFGSGRTGHDILQYLSELMGVGTKAADAAGVE
jgi:UDP-GlcNAc3NAcA epimerase